MTEFKVGDRVQFVDSLTPPDYPKGVGTIITIRSRGSWPISVKHDTATSSSVDEAYPVSSSEIEFAPIVSSLEDELRENYPKIYDDLVSTGRFVLKPREDVYTVTIRIAKSSLETEESVRDYLEEDVNDVEGWHLVSVAKVEDNG